MPCLDPSPIAEEDDDGTPGVAENVSTVTVGITNGKTFAVDRTVTLIFSGGTQGTHYSVSPVDGDTNAAGHQVVLPAETGSLPPVTVTAAANDSYGIRTLTVTGDLEGTAFGTRDITILDDETMTANIPAEGEAGIGGTPQVGQQLRAELHTIADANNLPTTEFPLRYSFQWVRVAAGGAETNVGTDSSTYPPIPSDAGSTIRVEVSFIDGAGNTVSRGGGYDDVVLPNLEVTVADNDGGIVADPTALTVAEGGTGAYPAGPSGWSGAASAAPSRLRRLCPGGASVFSVGALPAAVRPACSNIRSSVASDSPTLPGPGPASAHR